MKFGVQNYVGPGSVGAVELESGDILSVAFKDLTGEYQVVTLTVQGGVCVVTHEQTDDSLVVRRNKAQFVKG